MDNKLKINASHPGADVLKLTVFLNRHLNAPPDAEALGVLGPHYYSITRCWGHLEPTMTKIPIGPRLLQQHFLFIFRFVFFNIFFFVILDKTSVYKDHSKYLNKTRQDKIYSRIEWNSFQVKTWGSLIHAWREYWIFLTVWNLCLPTV